MIPILYINLDRRSDRNDYISKNLRQLSLSATRVAAIDGTLVKESEKRFVDYDKFILRMKRPIRQGEIGCAMSHRKIWQTMINDDIPYALIIEDDVTLHPDILLLLNTPLFYQKYDFINISESEPYLVTNSSIQKIMGNRNIVKRNKDNERLFKELDWRNNWKVYSLSRLGRSITVCECDPAPALASGYIISKKAAYSFLEATNALYFPIDYTWRYASGNLRQAFLSEPLLRQVENSSDIIGRNESYKLNTIQKIQRLRLKYEKNPRKIDVQYMYNR